MNADRTKDYRIISLALLERKLDEALEQGRSAMVWSLIDEIEQLDRDHEF